MHALIDLRWMIPGYTGGTEILARAFLDTLKHLETTDRFTVLIPSQAYADYKGYAHPGVQFIVTNGLDYYFSRGLWHIKKILNRGRDTLYSNPILRKAVQGVQVIFVTGGYIDPFIETSQIPFVLTIVDLQHEYYPQFFSTLELSRRRKAITEAIPKAAHICAISDYTRQTIIDRTGIPSDRISVTHLAVHPLFVKLQTNPDSIPDVLMKYHLTPGYLFYPAATWVHKNHGVLLQALAIVRDRHGLPLQLVCVGTAKEAHPRILEQIRELGLSESVHMLGYCPFEDVVGLYRHAAALTFPSLFEGFGMPVLEAMFSKCPVICSQSTSLPEIAGDAALYFDPLSPEELAENIYHLHSSNDLRESLIAKGLERASQYSWHRYTTEVVRVLRQIAEDG